MDSLPDPNLATVLILTPVKDATRQLPTYIDRLSRLTFPATRLSLGLLESDSADGTFGALQAALAPLTEHFRRIGLWKRDFGFRIADGVPRYDHTLQLQRRSVLARSRNHLLSRALQDEDWVLWLDSDISEYPPDILEQLLSVRQLIVQPNCVCEYGGASFDRNAWRDHGRLHLHDLRSEGDLVPLDSVGGTMLFVHSDLHRDGLIFPPFPYGVQNSRIRIDNFWLGEIETEGLGIMAADMGVTPCGLPNLEILHPRW
jgi:hypothetical protein